MAATVDRIHHREGGSVHPLHAVLLCGGVTLFLCTLLTDITYARSYNIQWSNFSSWLLVGALVLSGFALLFAVTGWLRSADRRGRPMIYMLLLLATWVLGFLNALQHARDAWGIMPGALVLSVLCALLGLAALWAAYTSRRVGGVA